ncbi:hypothetical protein HBA55_18620 [Pseudomaricurvus alkylphenolicus]|uniref:PspA/IM30 family protein n=1 Tax=Pseudomaricurvus alkylphenolicus TaxID=1306991 RepID=UPI001423C26D|nr:PspA/IM30 family protein [Pseudomaricurvus alkylphenolicus]NIB41625.1 hypothetical protein [Pseudomaricurvus alkylphenolicus]
MALVRRLLRLCQADLHHLLDHLEQPQILLKQAIREMEAELERTEQAVRRLQQEQDAAAARSLELKQLLQQLDSELDACLATGDEALARSLVRRQLESRRLMASLQQGSRQREALLCERQQLLNRQRHQLEGVRQKADLLLGAGSSPLEPSPCNISIGNDEVELALLQAKQQREQQLGGEPHG